MQALEAILSQSFSNEGKITLERLLNSYRVQAKPGENFDKNQTARDALFANLHNSWGKKLSLNRTQIAPLIAPFRMQLKQGLNRARYRDLKDQKSNLTNNPINPILDNRKARLREYYARIENAYFTDRETKYPTKINSTAIAGGPEKKSSNRGQCPKCHSEGIVLAAAYETENYYTCIYCGYQAYLNTKKSDLDLPYAAQLLTDAFGEHEPEE